MKNKFWIALVTFLSLIIITLCILLLKQHHCTEKAVVAEKPFESERIEEICPDTPIVVKDVKTPMQNISEESDGFVMLSEVIPDIIIELRYYSTYNFVGQRIDGYTEPVALLTKEAATALKAVSDDLVAQGYRLKIYDAYRPVRAVKHFVRWASDLSDTLMKPYFYPDLNKTVLFKRGYISNHSGHSRGSTVDLTLFDMRTEKEVDMGGTFDFFGLESHPENREKVSDQQYHNRMILRNAMVRHGFKPVSTEWWHFTLRNEPYPDTYFDFPVKTL